MQRAPVECRNTKDPTIIRIFWLKVGEQPKGDWERVPEKYVTDQHYLAGTHHHQPVGNRRGS